MRCESQCKHLLCLTNNGVLAVSILKWEGSRQLAIFTRDNCLVGLRPTEVIKSVFLLASVKLLVNKTNVTNTEVCKWLLTARSGIALPSSIVCHMSYRQHQQWTAKYCKVPQCHNVKSTAVQLLRRMHFLLVSLGYLFELGPP